MSPEQDSASHAASTRNEEGRHPLRSLHLLYHELRPQKSSYSYVVECKAFEEQVDLFTRLRKTAPPALHPELTFDDGHISNYEYALPILQQRNIQARFFITVGWTDQKSSYMGWRQLRSLHESGQLIGAHGWTHKLLTHCTDEELQAELKSARHALEDGLGTSITTMSLPGGRFNRRILDACQEAGYVHVYTSVPRAESIPFGITVGRLNIRGNSSLLWIESLFTPGSPVLAGLERQEKIKAAAKTVLGDRIYAKLWALLNRQESEGNSSEAYENSAHHQ